MSFTKLLVQMDVDSTFIQQEAIELLAAKAGVLDQVVTITNLAMQGNLDFASSLIERVKLLRGLPQTAIVEVQREITLTHGAAHLVETLHERGHEVSLVSGGFIDIIEPMIKELKIKFYRANKLEIVNGFLTGRVEGEIIDRAAKAAALSHFAQLAGVKMENTVAIGDGANDLDMMALASISIAFNAKPIVAQAAQFSITEPSLQSVLRLIGVKESD